MKTILFSLPGNQELTELLAKKMKAEIGECNIRKFPDGESYTRILSDVKDKCVVLVCTLHEPDEKLLPLYFLSQTAKSLGAMCTCLVAPYLAYMRQDKIFNEGEGVTSGFFGKLISGFADSITTIDPHLHRIHSLGEVYRIPNRVIHAADEISKYIKENIHNPVLIGPDSESEQWVADVAKKAGAPFTVLQKTRHGDRDVEVSVPEVDKFKDATPVLVDDIISTARTMIDTTEHLKSTGMKPAICIGIHAVFSGNAYQDLWDAHVKDIITCNTIPHQSNKIDLSDTIAKEVNELMHHQ
ncbi:MAG TPA: ribose-phosphate pyrophosphokinase [Muricauda sp.]|uniref:ribose-phosphate diphosphokinase n=3 Tax=Flagellimonas TaxID=444459 RepID=A0A3A1NHX6_9FLAO|nr:MULTISPECIES: ribose-phosphate pyrophosphokinase [Allomuricauda]MBC72268.1 phosphoribosylpyrophosphate synthetase [Allomuricauda sp.]UBZ14451.1 ribose-phosphate pyrophosphokinase [Allomuricauda aquimarina]MBO0355849.1 ribose-phosphate pyrophosphokinase [Allomuricauda aurea]RIV45097.1 ribose-phosphate pyrophosphokinase [Allomuricauda maritima]TXJ96276.1 ribose-phosphate pyrophosphokinase [Allomuricauda maritima]|tara:strand:+ start:5223 stop:6116 length:894 start_codon:yes stop_codon:yes gene_type:complete